MVTEIYLCTSYDLLLGCATSWESCHAYVMYIICYLVVVILVDLHSQKWINTSLFGLVVTCIEKYSFVPGFSISHIFISILIFFCCFSLILGQLVTLNILHPNKCIQHNIYTIFEKISSFSCFIFIHTRIQHVTLPTRKGVLIFHPSGQEDVLIGIDYRYRV